MKTSPDQYAVMGNPVAHSQSPAIHRLFAEQTHQTMEYNAIQVDTTDFVDAVNSFRQQGGRGLNVTVPFKQQAWALATELTNRAKLAGAVNTLSFEGAQIRGDNTDGVGLVRDLNRLTGHELKGLNILILGAGGAVRGVLEPILKQQPLNIIIANRTASKAQQLAEIFSAHGQIQGMGLDHVTSLAFDVVINGTAASLHGDVPAISPAVIGKQTCVYDMMYAAEATPFMRWAKASGAGQCFDGLGMLVEQAAESFYIWRQVRPDTLAVIDTIRKQMQGRSNT